MFKFLRNCQKVFPSIFIILHSANKCSSCSKSSPLSLVISLSTLAILKGKKKSFVVISTCIFLMNNNGENIFHILTVIFIHSCVCVFKSFVHFFIGPFVFYLLARISSLNILNSTPLSGRCKANIFFSVCLVCSFAKFVCWWTEGFHSTKYNLSFFYLRLMLLCTLCLCKVTMISCHVFF